MTIDKTPIPEVYIVKANSITDNRGCFARLFCEKKLEPVINNRTIKQINFSETKEKGAIRGLHFQYPPMAEMKLIRCICGSVFDVVVDLRKGSKTFLQWFGTILSKENMDMFCIPEGCAHGFQTLDENCKMLYLHTQFYSPENEGAIHYNDPSINIGWPHSPSKISERDQNHEFITSAFKGI